MEEKDPGEAHDLFMQTELNTSHKIYKTTNNGKCVQNQSFPNHSLQMNCAYSMK